MSRWMKCWSLLEEGVLSGICDKGTSKVWFDHTKRFTLTDARIFYILNLEVFCGHQPDGPFSLDNRPNAVVKRLTTLILGSGYNVTMDNWFASIPVVNEIVTQNKLRATLKKNKRELPLYYRVNTRPMPVYSSLFAFGEQAMLLSYVPKKYGNITLISSMNDSYEIHELHRRPDETSSCDFVQQY